MQKPFYSMEQGPSSPQPTEQAPPPPPQTTQPQTATTTSTANPASPSLPSPTIPTSFPNPSTAPSPKPPAQPQSQQSNNSQTRPPFNTRPWQPAYSHFSLPSPPMPASSASTSSSISGPPPPRGGIAIGVPAASSSSPSPPTSFSSLTLPTYSQQSQIRQPVQGMGMTGALGATSSMRPAGAPSNQLRPSQSSLRPQSSSSSQSPVAQNFQGHGMLRVSTLGSPGSPSPGSSQSPQTQNQPWLSSGTQGKPPLPTPSLRPQISPQSFQQRSHISQPHHHNMPTTLQQQAVSSSQQSLQPSASGQAQEHFNQQFPAPRSITQQQQMSRAAGLGTPRPPLGLNQSGASHPGVLSKPAAADTEEPSNRILSKRSIQELINQIDPSEKVDPEVEDILVEIADDFVESITTFGCSLAKHRKSSTLEAKDILLHLERNWNMALPGFGGDEIRAYKKPLVNEIHRERLAVVKKSILASDTIGKNTSGPSGGTKGHQAKGPVNTISSPPNPKIREAA